MATVRTPKKPKTELSLTSEQSAVVNAQSGTYRIMAGPGGSKSTCLVLRYVRLIKEGVSPDDILSMTFTSQAAKSMRDKAEEAIGVQKMDRVAGWSTFHSVALKFAGLEREHFPFELAEFPLATPPIAGKIVNDLARRFKVSWKELPNYISLQKRNRITPAQAIKTAEKEGKGEKLALAFKAYDAKLRGEGVLDFDSLLVEMVNLLEKKPEVAARWQYKFCQSDESQDNSKLEWAVLQLITKQYGNLLAVGDAAQCQPAGTLVSVPGSRSRKIGQFIEEEKVPVENITPGTKVMTWWRRKGYVKKAGERVSHVASREYNGPLLTIHTDGKQTRVTPDHWVWATLATECPYQHLVYMMYKESFGFRIGMCRTAVYKNNRNGLGGFSGRCYEERAEKAWILGVYETKDEAHGDELVKAAMFGVPTCVYEPDHRSQISRGWTQRIFDAVPRERGMQCLAEHGFSFEHPMLDRTSKKPNSRYFKIAACNLIPKLMRMPTKDENRSSLIDRIDRNHFEGLVYSLNVENDHTYLADDIPVGNCIYGFRGSDDNLYINFNDMFPGAQTLYLSRNFRSSPQIVNLCKKHGSVKELAEKFHTTNAEGPEVEVIGYPSAVDEAQDVAAKATICDTAILARTNKILRGVEDALSMAGKRYKLLGGSGFWSQPEVKSAVAFLGCAVSLHDGHVMGALRSPFHPSKFLKKTEIAAAVKKRQEGADPKPSAWSIIGGMTEKNTSAFVHFIHHLSRYRDVPCQKAVTSILQDLKAFDFYEEDGTPDSNPRENLSELIRISGRFQTLREFKEYINRVSAASKSNKAVSVGTCHSAKGLEFPRVFLVQVAQDILPHKQGEIGEEQRIFFVGISRAARELHISYSGQPSVFIKDMIVQKLDDVIEEVFA